MRRLSIRLHAVIFEMDQEVRKIESDERFPSGKSGHYPVATLEVNAPLALIQLEMRARYATLTRYAEALRRAVEGAR